MQFTLQKEVLYICCRFLGNINNATLLSFYFIFIYFFYNSMQLSCNIKFYRLFRYMYS